jgi:CubicO group peptidase (beta-lactamase class C family)
MNVVCRSRAIALAAVSLAASAAFARADAATAPPPAGLCSHDTFAIDGPVNVTLCATKTDAKTIAIAETFENKTGSFSHATTIDLVPGADSARGIDDVALAPLGITQTLHFAMRYKGGAVVLERALLAPGAIVLKR